MSGIPGKTDALDAALPKERHVGKYVVEKLTIGAYFSLLRRLETVPRDALQVLAEAWNDTSPDSSAADNNARVADVMLKLISRMPDELLNIIVISCRVSIDKTFEKHGQTPRSFTKQELEDDRELGLDGLVELLVTIWEINDLTTVFESIKKKLPETARNYLRTLAKIGSTNFSTPSAPVTAGQSGKS